MTLKCRRRQNDAHEQVQIKRGRQGLRCRGAIASPPARSESRCIVPCRCHGDGPTGGRQALIGHRRRVVWQCRRPAQPESRRAEIAGSADAFKGGTKLGLFALSLRPSSAWRVAGSQQRSSLPRSVCCNHGDAAGPGFNLHLLALNRGAGVYKRPLELVRSGEQMGRSRPLGHLGQGSPAVPRHSASWRSIAATKSRCRIVISPRFALLTTCSNSDKVYLHRDIQALYEASI
jgi:hypothetical protein